MTRLARYNYLIRLPRHSLATLGHWSFLLLAALALLLPFSLHAEDPQPTPTSLIKQGDAADARGDTRQALIEFLAADRLTPNSAPILVRISKQYSDLINPGKTTGDAEKMAQESLDFAKRAVDADPACAKAHLALGIGYGRLTEFSDNKTKLLYSKLMKDEVDKSITIDPTDAYAYHALGRWNYGIASLSPVLKMMAKYIYGGLPDASMEDAAECYKKAVALAPQRIIHHLELAHTYTTLGKTDLADKEWETILTLHAANSEDTAAQKEARETLKSRDQLPMVAKIPALR